MWNGANAIYHRDNFMGAQTDSQTNPTEARDFGARPV